MASTPAPRPVEPRGAATILVLRDDPFEVLMVRRHDSGMFASALVFPGGVIEDADRDPAWLDLVDDGDMFDDDARALRIAAYRETFEETALLLAHEADGNAVPCRSPDVSEFRTVVAESGGKLRLGALAHFGHWITPVGAPKRFDTHFFLCAAPAGQDAKCDGSETVALEWVVPRDALARAAAGERSILFPTRLNLKRLAESDSVASAIATARNRIPFTVLPRAERRDGGTLVVISSEAGYGETENFYPLSARS